MAPRQRDPDPERAREGARRNAIRVLSLLERARAPLSLKAIAEACGISKQTVERILADLDLDYPILEEPDPHHRQRRLYRLGGRGGRLDEAVRRKAADPRARFEGRPGTSSAGLDVELRVRAGGARLVEPPCLEGQRIEPQDDGSLRVRGRAPSKQALFDLVLARAPFVRIAAPASLDLELRSLVEEIWRDEG